MSVRKRRISSCKFVILYRGTSLWKMLVILEANQQLQNAVARTCILSTLPRLHCGLHVLR